MTAPSDTPSSRSDAIRDALYDAIVDRRLAPGTRLVEDEVGATFGASRTVVRAALQALAVGGVVTLERNRGAFVARPTPEEARQVFAARRMIEPGLAIAAAERIGPADVEALEAHLAREAAAIAERGPTARRAEIRASGDLHLMIAAIAGNDLVTRFLRDLVARSSLVIALYGRSGASSCARDEHGGIVEALGRRDGALAGALMREHIDHIEADLDYSAAGAADIQALLAR
ncbi:GntR family transcriptional regulator [Oharaeibacter diazotrophicus]|uniref:GntR family transcriptional regulator n=1 Tax=Oharaeibacter diazotrophicus TaxID=1920512 RepID=A0A4R6RDR5_9HYPH|nr:GntR family transcriptional regulator [Oharaeibacter diazotrophicus]TDP84330.1 GntR family transcriptional regulator [Oharaeibacter diazotrophicus]BBE73367.1 HTH-type transcriptional regulator LutR [Pleomorphomonas sp. SM30]GLS75159.1 GntR family transcriptional regulator [Oharaeibacter diazotrophicus]